MRGAKEARPQQSRHHVQPRFQNRSIFRRAANARLKFLLTSWQRGKTPIAFFPIARAGVRSRLNANGLMN